MVRGNGGTVYLGGFFSTIGSAGRSFFATVDSTSGLATGADLAFVGPVYAATTGGGQTYLGGGFDRAGNLPRGNMACLYSANTVGVPDEPAASVPFALARLSPNPAPGGTLVEYSLPAPAQVRIDVFDLMGRRVARIEDGLRAAGRHAVAWSGRGDAGALRAGLYYVRLEAAGLRARKALVLLR